MVTLKMGISHMLFGDKQSMFNVVRQLKRCPVVDSVTFKFAVISVPETAMLMGKTGRKKWWKQLRPVLHLVRKRGAFEI